MAKIDTKQVMPGSVTPNAVASGETVVIPSGRTLIFVQDLTVTGRIVFATTSRLVGLL